MTMPMTNLMQIILAVGLLFLGRKLYWGFVGAIGFIAVTEWALSTFQGAPDWLILLIGLAVGILGALLAVFIRMAGIGLAGFLSGAYIFFTFSRMLALSNTTLQGILAILGGILGAVLILTLFNWALITISSLSGALLISKFVPTTRVPAWFVILALSTLGVVFQFREWAETS